MPDAPSFQHAIEKARVKKAIAEQLAAMPRDAQRDILADLLLALDEEPAAPPAKSTADEAIRGRLRAAGRPGVVGLRKRSGRPKGAVNTNGAGRTEAIVAALKETPGLSIRDLAKLAYPEEEEATHKVRAILWSLKKQGRAKNNEPGKWEILP